MGCRYIPRPRERYSLGLRAAKRGIVSSFGGAPIDSYIDQAGDFTYLPRCVNVDAHCAFAVTLRPQPGGRATHQDVPQNPPKIHDQAVAVDASRLMRQGYTNHSPVSRSAVQRRTSFWTAARHYNSSHSGALIGLNG